MGAAPTSILHCGIPKHAGTPAARGHRSGADPDTKNSFGWRLWLSMRRWGRYCSWRRCTGTIAMIPATPRAIALGTAVGVFVAFTPTIGVQVVLAALITHVLGGSRIAAVIPVWISNPLTMGPMFAFTYQVGALVCPGSWTGTTDEGLSRAALGSLGEPLAPLKHLFGAGMQFYVPMLIGGLAIGFISAVIVYPLTLRFVRRHRRPQRPVCAI